MNGYWDYPHLLLMYRDPFMGHRNSSQCVEYEHYVEYPNKQNSIAENWLKKYYRNNWSYDVFQDRTLQKVAMLGLPVNFQPEC